MNTNQASRPVAGSEPERVWLRRFTKLTCFATLLLVFAGGLVKSHDAGLSVPDWPTTYGQNMFLFPPSKWIGNIFYEHTHRLIASSVGLLTLVLAFWLAFAEPRRWVKTLGWCALGAVIAQGILGGLTVKYLLPTWISVGHGVLAQTFFIITIVLAYSQSRERTERLRAPESPESGRLTLWAVLATLLIYVQLILGAVMRHSESGLAIPDFPAVAGHLLPRFNNETLSWINQWRFEHAFEWGSDLPPVVMGQVLIHFAHRVGALVVSLAIAALAFQGFRQPIAQKSRNALGMVLALLLTQLTLGMFTIWTHKSPTVTSFHVVTGAALLGASALLSLRLLPVTLGGRRDEAEAAQWRLSASKSEQPTPQANS